MLSNPQWIFQGLLMQQNNTEKITKSAISSLSLSLFFTNVYMDLLGKRDLYQLSNDLLNRDT